MLRGENDPLMELDDTQQQAIGKLHSVVEELDRYDEKELSTAIYDIAKELDIPAPALFKVAYGVIIGKERGPKLAGFIKTCGKEKILPILNRYL